MLKTYFNLQARNLLINSSIIEKPEYQELKSILLENQTISEKNINIINMKEETKYIIKYTHLEIYDLAKTEWVGLTKFSVDKLRCSLCNQRNQRIYYIKNKFNLKEMNIGSSCINHFVDLKTNAGEDFKSYFSKIEASEKLRQRKVDLYSRYPEIDNQLNKMNNDLELAPLLLPMYIYDEMKDVINKITNFKTKFLNDQEPLKRLDTIRLLLEKYSLLYDTKYSQWLTQNKNNVFCISKEIKTFLEHRNLMNTVALIRKNNGEVSTDSICDISHPSFILKHLDSFRLLMQQVASLTIQNNTVEANLDQDSQMSFLTLRWDFSTFMKKFGKNLLTGEVIDLHAIIDSLRGFNNDDVIEICDFLEDLYLRAHLTEKILILDGDESERKYKTNYIRFQFRIDEITGKMYVLIPDKLQYVIVSSKEFIKNIIAISFLRRDEFAEKMYKNILAKLSGYRNFQSSDDELLQRLELKQIWISNISDEEAASFSL